MKEEGWIRVFKIAAGVASAIAAVFTGAGLGITISKEFKEYKAWKNKNEGA